MMSLGQRKGVQIIAEAGVNHNGSLDMAHRLIDAARKAGADVVKFQTFRAGCLVSRQAERAAYQKRNDVGAKEETQYGMLARLELSEEDHYALLQHCRDVGIGFLSTPFDPQSLSFLLEKLRVERIKISSGDLTNAPLIWDAARSGLPLLLSTGMASLKEVEEALAVAVCGFLGNIPQDPRRVCDCLASSEAAQYLQDHVTLLHCTTEYPTPPEAVHLRAMVTLRQAFGVPVGYSDHSAGSVAAVAAVALGASVIEKHLTLDRGLPGPDHAASLDAKEFSALVESLRVAEQSLGSPLKVAGLRERENRAIVRKGLVAAVAIRSGERFTEKNLAVLRPECGVSPLAYWTLLGQAAPRAFAPEEPIVFASAGEGRMRE